MTELGTLDLFVLMLVDCGLDTPYALQQAAHLSLGAILPCLTRLSKLGLVTEKVTGPRRRRNFRLTKAGQSQLRAIGKHLSELVNQPPTDLESVARAFALAASIGERGLADKLVQAAVRERRKRSKQLATSPEAQESWQNPAALYCRIVERCESARLKAEAAALSELSQVLGEVLGKPVP